MFQHSQAATQSGNALVVSHVLRCFLLLNETWADCDLTGVGQLPCINLAEGKKNDRQTSSKLELWWVFADASWRRRCLYQRALSESELRRLEVSGWCLRSTLTRWTGSDRADFTFKKKKNRVLLGSVVLYSFIVCRQQRLLTSVCVPACVCVCVSLWGQPLHLRGLKYSLCFITHWALNLLTVSS